MIKALIYKALTNLKHLSDLTFELNNNPSVSKELGFNPLMPAPLIERFSSFLRDTENLELKTLYNQLVQILIESDVITGKSIAIDSCPIVVPSKRIILKPSRKTVLIKPKDPNGIPMPA